MRKRKVKRKLKKGGKILVLILLLVVIGVSAYFVVSKNYFSKKKEEPKKVVESKKEEKKAVDYEAKVFMVGDSLIHWGVYNDAKQADGSYDFKPMLQYVKPIVSQYDLAYYNQETILGGTAMGLSSYPRFNSPQEVGDAFIDAGFNMVSLATNHTMDKGEQGVLNSVAYWKAHPDVAYSGQWNSYEDRAAGVSKIYEVNNIKYAFISYTIWTNGLETPYGKDYLNNVYSPEKATADISAIRDKVDFVIVAMHWGTEYSFKTDYKQDEIAAHLSNLGVDLIIGAHPHVIQTVEYLNEGRTFVIYSLGNFLSDQLDVDNYTGLAMEVTLKKHVDVDDTVTNSVVDPKAELFYTVTKFYNGYSHEFRIIPYPKLDDSQLPNHWNLYEKYKAVVNECYPNLTWGLTYE